MAPRSTGSKTDRRAVLGAERAAQALELRKSGLSFRAIAGALGYRGPQGAYSAVRKALDRTVQPAADEVRVLELERLDALLAAVWPDATDPGDPDRRNRAAGIALKVMERRAQLLGLDAPAQIDIGLRVREEATRRGLDPDEAVREVEGYLREQRGAAR